MHHLIYISIYIGMCKLMGVFGDRLKLYSTTAPQKLDRQRQILRLRALIPARLVGQSHYIEVSL